MHLPPGDPCGCDTPRCLLLFVFIECSLSHQPWRRIKAELTKYAPGEAAYPLLDMMAAFGHHTLLLLSLWPRSNPQGLRTLQSRRRRRTRSVSGALELGKPPHTAPPINGVGCSRSTPLRISCIFTRAAIKTRVNPWAAAVETLGGSGEGRALCKCWCSGIQRLARTLVIPRDVGLRVAVEAHAADPRVSGCGAACCRSRCH